VRPGGVLRARADRRFDALAAVGMACYVTSFKRATGLRLGRGGSGVTEKKRHIFGLAVRGTWPQEIAALAIHRHATAVVPNRLLKNDV